MCKRTLLDQFYVLRGSDSIGKWWSIVEFLFENGIISEERQFVIKDSKLYIRIQDVYQHYTEAMAKRKDPTILDEPTLKNYLENDPRSFVSREKKFFGGAQRWAFVFKYKELGINLIKAASAEELKQKHALLGVVFDEDKESIVKAPDAEQMQFELKPNLDHLKQEEEITADSTKDSPF
ncbi:hypothetical protein D3C86_1492460 [compost metagenome]